MYDGLMDWLDRQIAATEIVIPSSMAQAAARIAGWKPGEPLVLNDLELEELPVALPEGLELLYLARNQLRRLPPLPRSLIVLDCSSNKLEELPTVLPPGLIRLECADNLLITIPSLPAGLETLDCSNNLLTELPVLPTGAYMRRHRCGVGALAEPMDDWVRGGR